MVLVCVMYRMIELGQDWPIGNEHNILADMKLSASCPTGYKKPQTNHTK